LCMKILMSAETDGNKVTHASEKANSKSGGEAA
jgi:hypothetical protein